MGLEFVSLDSHPLPMRVASPTLPYTKVDSSTVVDDASRHLRCVTEAVYKGKKELDCQLMRELMKQPGVDKHEVPWM